MHDPAYELDFLRNKLKLKSHEVKKDFEEKYPHVKKFLDQRGIELAKIREHSAKVIAAGALTSTLFFTPITGQIDLKTPMEISKSVDEPQQKSLLENINEMLPERISSLTREQEKKLEQLFQNTIGIPVRATLEGEHLNTTYGLIGLEQHLMRYPGDSVTYMAPGKGAWGYFAKSKSELTPDLVEKEKWYAVVQTLYLPDWKGRLNYLRDWYKYRKVLIVNTKNGNAVVADIADAGPAAWTGKVFGGSPEVMEALGGKKYTKGAVVMFFVDDPNNTVPLGPVDYNNINEQGLLRSSVET